MSMEEMGHRNEMMKQKVEMLAKHHLDAEIRRKAKRLAQILRMPEEEFLLHEDEADDLDDIISVELSKIQ